MAGFKHAFKISPKYCTDLQIFYYINWAIVFIFGGLFHNSKNSSSDDGLEKCVPFFYVICLIVSTIIGLLSFSDSELYGDDPKETCFPYRRDWCRDHARAFVIVQAALLGFPFACLILGFLYYGLYIKCIKANCSKLQYYYAEKKDKEQDERLCRKLKKHWDGQRIIIMQNIEYQEGIWDIIFSYSWSLEKNLLLLYPSETSIPAALEGENTSSDIAKVIQLAGSKLEKYEDLHIFARLNDFKMAKIYEVAKSCGYAGFQKRFDFTGKDRDIEEPKTSAIDIFASVVRATSIRGMTGGESVDDITVRNYFTSNANGGPMGGESIEFGELMRTLSSRSSRFAFDDENPKTKK